MILKRILEIITLSVLLLILQSCLNSDGIKVEVYNRSNKTLTNVVVSTSDDKSNDFLIGELKQGEKRKGFLDMSETTGDGAYSILFERKNEELEGYGFGYYTNGAPLDRKVIFYIEEDTVYTEFKGYY